MLENASESRSSAVVAAALQTFMNYGFKRTTMDDIARAAGMSRPALYLVYRNKKDIFRACIIAMTEQLQSDLDTLLCEPGTTAERIFNVLEAGIVKPHELVGATQHGEELFELKSDIAADLFRNWMDVIEAAILRILREDVDEGRVDLAGAGVTDAEIAELIVDGAEGIKMRLSEADALPGKLAALVRLIVGPLAATK